LAIHHGKLAALIGVNGKETLVPAVVVEASKMMKRDTAVKIRANGRVIGDFLEKIFQAPRTLSIIAPAFSGIALSRQAT
jgi:hypothetical protein